MVKIAVTGKGGTGKTTITAGLARSFAKKGYKVIAIDMDPSPNLLISLGCKDLVDEKEITPLVEMSDLIEERTGASPEGSGLVFKINPKVDDIIEKSGIKCKDDVMLLILGTIRQGGGGCFCPANALARRLVDHLSGEVDILFMDMEAGVEHLGRGTTQTVEILLTIVEPSLKSIETAGQIKKLASNLGIKMIFAVLNKIKNEREEKIISEKLLEIEIPVFCTIPYDETITNLEIEGYSIFDSEVNLVSNKIDELSSILEKQIGFFHK
jgi:CO dehydrogenase maturation factor